MYFKMETQRVQLLLAQAVRELEDAEQAERQADTTYQLQRALANGKRAAVRVLERRLQQAQRVRITINQ
jgi:hypothetical protein